MSETTMAIWLTHNPTTVAAIRKMLQRLEAADALEFTQVRIFALEDDGRAVGLPAAGELRLPDGEIRHVSEGQTISWRELPAEGVLLVTRAPSDS